MMVGSNIRFEIKCVIRVNINNLVCLKIEKTILNFLQGHVKYKNKI
jgi:hypothetical protein